MLRRTASCLLFTLLAGAHLCPAVVRVKIAVVQTHTGVNRGGARAADSNTPDPVSTQCNGGSGIYARDLGFYCQGPVIPLDQPPGAPGHSLFVDISVVMPDSARLVFHCSTVLDPECEAIPDYPAATAVVCSDFVHGGSAYKDCTVSGSSPTGIGVYRAALHGDRMTIFGANWERHYFKYGTWQYPDPPAADTRLVSQETRPSPPADPRPSPAQDANPAAPQVSNSSPPQEPNPAPPQETKPALPPEAPPASPQEPSPAPPQEAKPALPPETQPGSPQEPSPAAPQDTNPANPQDAKPETAPETKHPDTTAAPAPEHASAAHAPATSADQSVDPSVIAQAKAGDAAAQYKLGYDYYLGRGVALDYVQAAIWWKKAADQGFPQAQNNLGVLYNAGKGVPQSYTEAYFWENLAAARASGPLQAQFAKNRDESASRLWFMARLSVQRKAAKWAADHPVPPRSHEPPGAPKP